MELGTIFFSLVVLQTELSGIKWRKLVYCELGGGGAASGHCGGGGEPLEDPVLRSYARCLDADILCVWRRVPTPRSTDMFEPGPPPPPPLSLSTSKELWIFWYGEEPDLGVLIAPELNTPGKSGGIKIETGARLGAGLMARGGTGSFAEGMWTGLGCWGGGFLSYE